jgi:hypothetical protein
MDLGSDILRTTITAVKRIQVVAQRKNRRRNRSRLGETAAPVHILPVEDNDAHSS